MLCTLGSIDMELDAFFLSRVQFALTIMFHYIFPPLTIGLSVFMVLIEFLWLKTGDPLYESMARFWTKIFAVNFAMGVATGIVMEFEFGTNWARYSKFVGDVFGSALAAEGIFAFFLESGFLSVLVFGWGKVSRKVHFFSSIMVCLGSIFSSIWITVANSWQQTPAGYKLVQTASGLMRAEITDFWAMVFNPSTVPRLLHVWIGAFVLGAFFVLSISAYYLLKNRHLEFARRSFVCALIYATLSSFAAGASGHLQACEVAEQQPAKLAAMEAHFETGTGGTGLYLFGIPNVKEKRVDAGIAIPDLLSLLVYFDPNKPVKGLDQFPVQDHPPVEIPFLAFHTMVLLGGFFITMSGLGLFFLWRKTIFTTRWLLWIFVFGAAPALVANETGWITAEVGRQPWVVYGLLRTIDGYSHTVPAEHILASIIMFSCIYALLFWVWVYVLHTKIMHGPDEPVASATSETSSATDVLKSAAHYIDPSGSSLTLAKLHPGQPEDQQRSSATGAPEASQSQQTSPRSEPVAEEQAPPPAATPDNDAPEASQP